MPPSIGPAWFDRPSTQRSTNVDIVAIPPIGAHHLKIWTSPGSSSPWLRTELVARIPEARVLLYNHGQLQENTKIDSLGQRLLNALLDERKHERSRRPLFFICHSTGGLVAKACLWLASRAEPTQAILTSCYGIAFFATPHQGSSYLSADEYASSIYHLLHLEQDIPVSLREQFRPRQERLWHLSNIFSALSADLKVWSFLETVDSTLTAVDLDTGRLIEFLAPITSIRSGALRGMGNEHQIAMATDHVGTASFHGQELARDNFLTELADAVRVAVELSSHSDTPLDLERKVMVQVHGFFEDPALGISDESPLKLWTASVSLEEYLNRGPAACLRERLNRDQPTLSRVNNPQHQLSHIIPGPKEHRDNYHESQRKNESGPSIPPVQQFQSFIEPNHPPQTIHITEAASVSGYFDRPSSESPPQPVQSKRKSSIARIFGLGQLRSHKPSVSVSSSQRSSSRPASSSTAAPQQSGFLAIPPSTRDRINQQAEAQDIPRSVPRFNRPEPNTETLLWIHVPYTHTGWVPQVIRRTCQDRQEPSFMRKFVNGENWYLNHSKARHLEPHSQFVRPQCIHSRQRDVSSGIMAGAPEDPQLALYVPYLHWDTYHSLIRRRRVVDDRMCQGRSRPVPTRIAKSNLEAQLIWQYLGREPPIHFRRTLDQFGYPNLRSTVTLDDNQVLWKRTRRPTHLEDQLKDYLNTVNYDDEDPKPTEFMDGNVLMVDQLWLWIVDERTVVTFFPHKEATTSDENLFEQSNLYDSVYNELNGDLARRFETAGDLAALIILHAVTVLLDRTLNHDLQVLRIFEESTSTLTERVMKSFVRFRNRSFALRPSDHNRTAEGKKMTASQRDQRDYKSAKWTRDDLSHLFELRDLEDELSTIMELLDQQETVIKSMIKYWDRREGDGKIFVDAAQLRIDDYRAQLGKMKENCRLSLKSAETILDLKQRQANLDEARMARWQAEESQNQARSVMVFTIFTVIFLPLSFFTSLFGINAREWSGESENLSLAVMFEIAAPASFAIIAVALLMAFNEKLRVAVTQFFKPRMHNYFVFNPQMQSDESAVPNVEGK